MDLTDKEKKQINKDIANRVYAEGLKFKGQVEELSNTIVQLRKELFNYRKHVDIIDLRLKKEERNIKFDLTVPSYGTGKTGEYFHSLMEDYYKNIGEKFKYQAPKDWEDKVHEFYHNNPRNKVAELISSELKSSNLFPVNHGKAWIKEEDKDLNEDLKRFIQYNARHHRRNPSSIAFRIIRQLKYIGIYFE